LRGHAGAYLGFTEHVGINRCSEKHAMYFCFAESDVIKHSCITFTGSEGADFGEKDSVRLVSCLNERNFW
jgi:hypothetical protein